MPNAQTAVAPAAPNAPVEMKPEVISISGRGDVERITARVTIPVDFQYAITKWVNVNPDRDEKAVFREEVVRVGLTIDAYDYMNRVLGVSFFFPETVPNERGERVPNPIWVPPDFTTVLVGAVWVNPMGQHVVGYELVSTDFWRIYQDKRANSSSAKMMEPPDLAEGEMVVPTFDKRGDMNLTLAPGDEMKAYKELTRMRALGPRYAQTVGRVRLLKMASGLRSLPTKSLTPYPLTLTGYRDQLDARERVKAATGTETAMYGRTASTDAFASSEEMAEAGANEDREGPIVEPATEPGRDHFDPTELPPDIK